MAKTARSKTLNFLKKRLGIMNFMKLFRTVSKSFIGRLVAITQTPSLKLFFGTLLYYISLYFSINNRTLILLTFLYWLWVYYLTKNLKLSLFAGLLATLLFPKGRAYELLLLPKEDIERWAWFDISYFFPVYIADVFLGLLVYLYLRGKQTTGKLHFSFTKFKSLWFLLLFIFWVVISGTLSIVPEVGWLSSLQLIRMMVLMAMPLLLFNKQKTQLKKTVFSVIAAVLLFEAGWVLLQRLAGGPLGKDIEVYLPGAQFGILSSENRGLLRLTGTFFESSILGTFLLMQMAILLPAILGKQKINHQLKIITLMIIGLASLALVFTGSRILYAIWLIGAFASWRYWQKLDEKNKIKIPPKVFTLLAIVIVGVAATLAPYLARRIQTLSDVFTQYGSATYRLQMMRYAARLALDKPILGVGINLSPFYLATEFKGEQLGFDPTYPHNLFFQLLAETGLVGVSVFLLFAYLVVKPFLLGLKADVIKEYNLAAGIYLLATMFYPIFLNHPELSSYFFLYAGLALFDQQKSNHA